MQTLYSFIGGFIFCALFLVPFLWALTKMCNKYAAFIMASKDNNAYCVTNPSEEKLPTPDEIKQQETDRLEREYEAIYMRGEVTDKEIDIYGIKEEVVQ